VSRDILAVIARHRAALRAGEVTATRQMHATWRRVETVLRRRIADIETSLATYHRLGRDAEWLRREQVRLVTLQQQVQAQVEEFAANVQEVALTRVNAAASAGTTDAAAAIVASTPPSITADAVRLPTRAVRDMQAIARFTQFRRLFQRVATDTGRLLATELGDLITTGLAEGRNPRETARAMRRLVSLTPAARPLPVWRAESIARTETMRAYRTATIDTYRQNTRVVRGWVWISALDRTTCASCIAQHGTVHPLDEEMATHPRCRCVAAPQTVPWSELGAHGLDDPAVETGPSWFRRQDADTQRQVVGAAKHKALRGRAITLPDLVHRGASPWGPSTSEAGLAEARRNAARRRAAA